MTYLQNFRDGKGRLDSLASRVGEGHQVLGGWFAFMDVLAGWVAFSIDRCRK